MQHIGGYLSQHLKYRSNLYRPSVFSPELAACSDSGLAGVYETIPPLEYRADRIVMTAGILKRGANKVR